MRKRIIFVVAVLLILAGIFIIIKVLASVVSPQGKGALQVNTNIKADVYLNGKLIGTAPFCKCNPNETLASGEYVVRMVPLDKSVQDYTVKTTIEPGVLTAIERTFLPGSLGSSYILTLEKTSIKTPQVYITSVPDGAVITMDGNATGATALLLKDISASEHEIEIQKQGFAKKTIRVRAVPFYKLIVSAFLGTEGEAESPTPTLQPTTSVTPTPTTSVKVKQTPTGFLRVRDDASLGGNEIARVNPGDTLPLIEEKPSWYKIQLPDGKTGWISADYADKTVK